MISTTFIGSEKELWISLTGEVSDAWCAAREALSAFGIFSLFSTYFSEYFLKTPISHQHNGFDYLLIT